MYDIYKVKLFKDYKSDNSTDLILNERNTGLILVILEDNGGTSSHTVGIDVRKWLILICMEEKAFVSNKDNLSICCGDNAVFRCIKFAAELNLKPQEETLQLNVNRLWYAIGCSFPLMNEFMSLHLIFICIIFTK